MATFGDFLRAVFSASHAQHVSDLLSKFTLKAKFHYASWLGASSELARSWFEPDNVMEFGFKATPCVEVW